MYEGQREKELQLELTKPRNPYLAEQFGNRRTTVQGVRTAHAKTVYRKKSAQIERQKRVMLARQKQKKKRQQRIVTVIFIMFALTAVFYWLVALFLKDGGEPAKSLPKKEDIAAPVMNDTAQHPEWITDYLTPNEYSRPGDALEEVNSIFVHYTANPGTSAAQNRSYFEQLKDTHERSASAHFIIGYDGEIIHCIPLNEIAYGVQTRNFDSISIECSYIDEEEASFTKETHDALVELLAYLLQTYHLSTEDILRHYDCGGKLCPLYYVENEDAWETLKQEVAQKLN